MDAKGNEIRQFGSGLPTRGSGTAQASRSWSVAKGGAGAGVQSPVQYDRNAEDAMLAGWMPLTLRAGNGDVVSVKDDPVRYAEVAGLRISPEHIENVRKYPELAAHLLNESIRVRSMAQASTGYMASTRVHASLGPNYPADAKASAFIAL
ncbi:MULTISPECIES: hypothetical protein [unclassified Caballeronia]|uniref:hypothetical protein n=1 Tax=unclassified Caballeronia TaxID=2646786 RepID=UPI001F16C028|nr:MULTISPECIES: hypothetical protein [unclassified Caballeronia]MCE4542125.1 hypothetical protein [Caballeronia sp. PC1]MCE4568829.1 hypothetical protein [Caballeronia sp. CLC5]